MGTTNMTVYDVIFGAFMKAVLVGITTGVIIGILYTIFYKARSAYFKNEKDSL